MFLALLTVTGPGSLFSPGFGFGRHPNVKWI